MSIYKESVSGISRAVDSILNQTFNDFEFIIIIDDPTNEDGIDLIKNYAASDPRFNYVIHEKNRGISFGCNEAIRMAKGEYIPDDYSYPNRLQVQYDYMQEHSDVDALGASLRYVDFESNLVFEIKYKPIVGDEIKKYCPVGHPTVFIRKNTYYKYGFYVENIWEYELWIIWHLKGVVFHNLQDYYYDYYQTYIDKERKTKPYLLDAINCKTKYTKELNFKFGDYFYLFAEKTCSKLPATLIIKLVYMVYKIKHFKPMNKRQ